MDKVKIVDVDGKIISLEQWQKRYELPVGSTKIGKYFSWTESRFRNDIRMYGEVYVNEPLMRVLDQWRKDANKAFTINAFNRDDAHQKSLTDQGFRTATHSPHVVKRDPYGKFLQGGFAADKDTVSKKETIDHVNILRESAKTVGFKIRIGYLDYLEISQTFIHVDVGPEYYATGKPWNKLFHPIQWERESVW